MNRELNLAAFVLKESVYYVMVRQEYLKGKLFVANDSECRKVRWL